MKGESKMRKAEAYWMEKYSRWQIVAYRCGVRRSFYSSKPGKLGKHEAEAKADKWLKTFDTTKKAHDALDAWLADKQAKVAPTTYRSVSLTVNKWLRQLPNRQMGRLSVYDLQKVLDACAKVNAKSTVEYLAGLMTEWIKYCRLRRWETIDLRDGDLEIGGHSTRARRAANEDELHALMTATPDDDWYTYVYQFAVLTGMRRGEMLGLQWQDVDLDKRQLRINRAVNRLQLTTDGKTSNAIRTVPLQQGAVEVLNAQKCMLRKAGISGLVVFPSPLGLTTNVSTFDNHWIKFRSARNITITLHELRHTFISICKADVPEPLLKQVVGHSVKMDTYKTYGHAVASDSDKIIGLMDGSFESALDSTL